MRPQPEFSVPSTYDTGGNGYAFLKLYRRTRDAVWLERARAFAMTAIAQCREAREQFERAYLQQQLLLCNGKVGQLAKRVGMERTHLYRKLRSLGVDFRNISEEAE